MAETKQERSLWLQVNFTQFQDYVEQSIILQEQSPDKRFNIYCEGAPGEGKTTAIKRIAAKHKRPYYEFMTAAQDLSDIMIRMPDTKSGENKLIQYMTDLLPKEEGTLVCFDEYKQGSVLVRRAVLKLLESGELGTYKLPRNTMIAVLSNRASDVRTEELESHEIGRFFFRLTLKPSAQEFEEYFMDKPNGAYITGFMKIEHESRYIYDPETNLSLCNPRDWEKVCQLPQDKLEYANGILPAGIGSKFAAYVKQVDLYKDIKGYLTGAKAMPEKYSDKIAVATAITIELEHSETAKKLDDTMTMILDQNLKGSTQELDTFVMSSCLKTYMRLKKAKEPVDLILSLKDPTMKKKMVGALQKFTAYANI